MIIMSVGVTHIHIPATLLSKSGNPDCPTLFQITSNNPYWIPRHQKHGYLSKNGVCVLIIRIVRSVCLTNIHILATILPKYGNPDNLTLF